MKKEVKRDAFAFPTPVFIVGTYGKNGEATAMNVAWGGICSQEPPCVMIAIRDSRYTLENIKRDMVFTINIPDAAHMAEADYLGIVSGRDERKLEKAGLTTVKAETVKAPIICEFPYALECAVVELKKVGQHNMIIAEVLKMQCEEECLDEKGRPDPLKIQTLSYTFVDNSYNRAWEKAGDAFKAGLDVRDR